MLARTAIAVCVGFFLASALPTATRAQSREDLFGRQIPTPPPDPSAALRISREASMGWRGTYPTTDLEPLITKAVWESATGKSAPKELGLSEEAARAAFVVSAPVNGGEIKLHLNLPSDTAEAREAGRTFLDAVVGRVVPGVISSWSDAHNRIPVERAEGELQETGKSFEAIRGRVSLLRAQVRKTAEVLDPAPDAVRQAASRLDQERQRLTLELAGQTARQKALQDRLAKLAATAEARTKDDPIAAELEAVLKLRQQEAALSEQAYKSGGLAQAELQSGQAKVADAKVRLLERREAAARASGTDLLGELNKELVMLSITTVESEARLEHVSRRMEGLSRAIEIVDELELAQSAAARANERADRAESKLQDAVRQYNSAPGFAVTLSWSEPVITSLPTKSK